MVKSKGKISIRDPLEVLRSNDFPTPLKKCKMIGLEVNQTLLSSVFKLLENGFVIK